MIMQVILDIIPFLIVFLIYIIFFTLVVVTLDAEVDNEDYPNIHPVLAISIQIFRNSIGDISAFKYERWAPDGETKFLSHNLGILLIWFFWFYDILIMLVILLNFLIAEVSQTYDRVESQGSIFVIK